MKPLKAHPYAPRKLSTPCFVQRKYNGVRALYQRGRFYSGDEILWNEPVLAHLSRPLEALVADHSVALDGELYVHGWSLQSINRAVAVKRIAPSSDTPSITYVVFDVVAPGTPFIDRIHYARELLRSFGPGVSVAPTIMAHSELDCDRLYEQFVGEGYEGAIYRLGDCPYTIAGNGSTQDNRVLHMLKRKFWRDDNFRVVAVVEGSPTDLGGKYVGSLGAFVLSTEDGKTFRAAPAFTNEERLYYFNNPPINQFAIVKYLNLSDDGIPLNPTVLAIREA